MYFSTAAGAGALEEMQCSFPLSGTSKGLRKLCIADMFSQHASHTSVLQHVSRHPPHDSDYMSALEYVTSTY